MVRFICALLAIIAASGVSCGKSGGGSSGAPPRAKPEPPAKALQKDENLWFDPVDETWWIVTKRLMTWMDADDACGNKLWRQPQVYELRRAWSRGICPDALCPLAWSIGVDYLQALTFDMNDAKAGVVKKDEKKAASYCIQRKAETGPPPTPFAGGHL